MEALKAFGGEKVYLDTNVFIYAVEGLTEYATAVEVLFGSIEDGTVSVFTSELTLAEAMTKPFEMGRQDIAQIYEVMLTPSQWLSVLPIERSILIEAARLQARLNIRLPDAIHVASAVASGCVAVISNDRRLRVPESIELIRLK